MGSFRNASKSSILTYSVKFAAVSAACMVLTPIAYAGAWTLNSGDFLAISTLDQVSANQFFTPSGDMKDEIEFSKSDLRLYAEYGLRDDLTLVIQTGFQAAQVNSPSKGPLSRAGFSNLDAGLRYRMWQSDNFVVSTQAMVSIRDEAYGLPGAPLSFTESGTDLDVRVMAGHSWNIRDYKGFSDIQIGRREFGNGAGTSHNLDLTAGIEVNPVLQLLGQVFLTEYQGDRSHEALRLQPSLVYKTKKNRKYQVGAFAIVSGKNATRDQGVTLSIWQSY